MQWPAIVLAVSLCFAVNIRTAAACMYNVRETGFVYLGFESYRLWCYVDQNTPSRTVAEMQRIAEQVLTESSVQFEVIRVDADKTHPALDFFDPNETKSLPAAVLLSPQEAAMPVSMPQLNPDFASSFRSLLIELVHSPLRDELVRQAAENYAVVLLMDGADANRNATAVQAVHRAIESIHRHMEFMPKDITKPPVLVRLPRQHAGRERILMWSLGADETQTQKAHAAVIYGRARWIGPLLKGNQITTELIENILSVVGADCECGLDRRLVRGTILPVKWNEQTDTLVADDLGFDPEDPTVKMEVSQILRLNSTAYPSVPAARRARQQDDAGAAAYDLPIPFVEDTVAAESVLAETGTRVLNSVVAIAALAALTVAAGLLILLRRGAENR